MDVQKARVCDFVRQSLSNKPSREGIPEEGRPKRKATRERERERERRRDGVVRDNVEAV